MSQIIGARSLPDKPKPITIVLQLPSNRRDYLKKVEVQILSDFFEEYWFEFEDFVREAQ